MPWSLVHARGRQLSLTVNKSGCTTPQGLAIAGSSDSVTITAYGKAVAGSCTSDMVSVIENLTLAVPMGNRRVVHGG